MYDIIAIILLALVVIYLVLALLRSSNEIEKLIQINDRCREALQRQLQRDRNRIQEHNELLNNWKNALQALDKANAEISRLKIKKTTWKVYNNDNKRIK